jgi:transposase InsO family protein
MTADGGGPARPDDSNVSTDDLIPTEWFAASDLVGLPGLPSTKRGVLKSAERQGWLFREETTRGGTARLFAYTSLPVATQIALIGRGGVARPETPAATASAAWEHFERLPEKKQAEAKRRLAAIQRVEILVAGGMPKRQAQASVASAIGESDRTIRNWLRLVERAPRGDRLPLLAPAHAGGRERAGCSPEAWEYFKADYLRLAQPAVSACYARLQRIAGERGWTVPSHHSLIRRLERELPRAAIVRAREGEEALKRCYPAQVRSRAHFHALEAVNMDGHKFDVLVRWEDGTVSRPIVAAMQDLYSGKILGWRIGPTETSELIRLVIADVITRWGIPEKVWMDNGRGFASKLITGGAPTRYRFKIRDEDPTGILVQLDAETHWTTPRAGQSKPLERAWRDWCEYVARAPLCEGAYVGSSPERKPENAGTRAVPIAEFRAHVAREAELLNQRKGRETLVCGGIRSFDDAFFESYQSVPIRKATEEQRRLLLLAAEAISAQRETGEIRLFGNRYWTEALGQVAGRKVMVRFDPDDLAADVHVYQLDGRYVASAPRREAAGFDDVAQAKEHAKLRRDFMRRNKAVLDAERRLTVAEIAAMQPKAPEPVAPPPAPVVAGAFGLARKVKPAPAPDAAPAIDTDALIQNALERFRRNREELP